MNKRIYLGNCLSCMCIHIGRVQLGAIMFHKRHTAILIVRHHSNYSRFMSSGYSISTCPPLASVHHVLFSAPAGHLHGHQDDSTRGLQTLQWQRIRPINGVNYKWFRNQKSFKLTVSLYNLTILHPTLYPWVLCVKNQLLCARWVLDYYCSPRFTFMKLHSLNAVAEWPGWWSIILQKAHSSTNCEELQYTHWVLAGWPHFVLLLHLSILFCSLQQQAIIKTTKTKPPEDCRPCNDGRTGQCIYAIFIILVASKLTASLYNLAILHSTLYLCVLRVKNQLCAISLSLVNTVQRCIILILVYKSV